MPGRLMQGGQVRGGKYGKVTRGTVHYVISSSCIRILLPRFFSAALISSALSAYLAAINVQLLSPFSAFNELNNPDGNMFP